MTPYKRKEVIGDCTLYLGDCAEIMPTLGKVDAVVTDPPYGMAFKSNYRQSKHKKIINDENTEYLEFACNIITNHSSYVFCRWDNLKDIKKPKSLITWIKNNWSMGNLKHEHARQTEVIAFYNGINHFFPNGRPQDVVKSQRTENKYHPTEKPVSLMGIIIFWTDGQVFDPFMGSGTTGVACVKQGRKFTGIEICEEYFDIACERIREAYAQPDMLVERANPPQEKQTSFLEVEAA